MNITRYNYEEYFLLYVDRELTTEEQQLVEVFIDANPDLKEELEALQQLTIQPDENIVFDNKELMMKQAGGTSLVHEGNYEEYFVLYADNELTDEEKAAVEEFISHHPQYQPELQLLQSIRLEPDTTLAFADKASLYREEDDDKVVIIRWWRIAIAAIVILFLGTGGWYSLTDHASNPPAIAEHKEETKPGTGTPRQAVTGPSGEGSVAPAVVAAAPETAKAQTKESTTKVKTDIPTISDDKSNDLQPVNVQRYNSELKEEPVIPATSIVVVPAAQLRVNSMEEAGNTERRTKEERLAYAMNSAREDDPVYVNTANNKNRFRGLFRKVSRVFEKTTNTESNEKALRIANLEIALK